MADSVFKMIDVGDKAITSRVAKAQGRIELSPAAYMALVQKKNPKGDVLALAETSGILAAKSVPSILPLCHPLPIEQVLVSFELQPERNSVIAFCEVRVSAKTGAEMEALAGVNGALLCVYDLSKAVDPVLKISDIRLNSKVGGKSGQWFHPEFTPSETKSTTTPFLEGLKLAVLTVSDRASRKEVEDKSGAILHEKIEGLGGAVVGHDLVADEKDLIASAFRKFAFESEAQIIISTGGTGLSPRDVTPEALGEVCERMIPGFGELLRADGAKHKTTAWLSRSGAGLLNQKIIVALPGSTKAVQEGLAVLAPLLKHALHTARGGDHAVP